MLAKLDELVARVSATLALVASALTGLVIAVMVVDVSIRNLQGSSVAGAFEIVTILLVAIVFLGLAQAERTDSHVKLSLITSRLRPRWQIVVRAGSSLLSLAIAVLFSIATWQHAFLSVERGEYEVGLLNLPVWPARLLIAVGFSVLVLEILLGLRRTYCRQVHDRVGVGGAAKKSNASRARGDCYE